MEESTIPVEAWISPAFLDWNANTGSYVNNWNPDCERGYEMLASAEKIIEANENRDTNGAALGLINRAIRNRLQYLTEIYSLQSLPGNRKVLDILSDFGVMRPALVENIRRVRNACEHNDALPPDTTSLRILIDSVWYILRYTDLLLRNTPDTISFDDTEDHWIAIDFPILSCEIHILALLKQADISKNYKSGWFRSSITSQESLLSCQGNLKGTMFINDDTMLRIARKYFYV